MMNSANYYDDEFKARMDELGISMDELSYNDDSTSNVVIDENLNVDINMDAIQMDNVSEDEIDEMFNIDETSFDGSAPPKHMDAKKKESQTAADNNMVREFVNNPSHDNFNKLWKRFYFGIKGHAYKFMHDWDSADDIACQTFIRAWECKEQYDIEKAKFSTWLYTICRNLCLGELNRRSKCNIVNNDISDMYDSTMLLSSSAYSTDSTQYIHENGELVANSASDLVMKMYDTSINEIDNLGGNYAKILRMKLIDDKKIREIADELNMNESTVKNYLYKGKEVLEGIMKNKHKRLYEMYLESAADEAAKMM